MACTFYGARTATCSQRETYNQAQTENEMYSHVLNLSKFVYEDSIV